MTNEPNDPSALTPETAAFIDKIGLYYENYGIPRIAGRMFGLFIATAEPLSAERIAALLDTSLSSVSTNVRALIANGWVEKTTLKGDRTTYYRFSPNAWESVMTRRKQSFAPLKALADQMAAALPPDSPASGQLQEMSDWAAMLMGHYDNLIESWRAYKATPPANKGE